MAHTPAASSTEPSPSPIGVAPELAPPPDVTTAELHRILRDTQQMYAQLSSCAEGARRTGLATGRGVGARLLKAHGQLLVAALHATQRAEASAHALRAALRAAGTDFLTGLPNRTTLHDRLVHGMAGARRDGDCLAVFFIDLDEFKHINDTMGHAAGDRVLQHVAGVLRGAVRETDTVSRHGGDEFLVVLPHSGSREDASALAHKLIGAVRAPLLVQDRVLTLSVSIGISVFPDDGETADALIVCADTAMYRVKNSGGGAFAFHAASQPCARSPQGALVAGIDQATQSAPHDNASGGQEPAAEAAALQQAAEVAMVARELRRPLLAIAAALNAQRHGDGAAASADASVRVSRQLLQLSRLVGDLDGLNAAQPLFAVQREPIDFADVLADVCAAARPLLRARSQGLEVRSVGCPLPMLGDAVRLTQVLSRLLENASRFTPALGRIEVSVCLLGGVARLLVSDSGCGLDGVALAELSKCMASSWHGAVAVRGPHSGGLALAAQVVRAHDGRIEVHSGGPGRGCAFIVTLPLAAAAPAHTPA